MSELARQVGKKVSLVGEAADAKGGAVVVHREYVVYVASRDSWPPGVVGKRVRVSGTLQKRQHIPEAKVDEHGGVSAGARGQQYVLDDADWAVVAQ